MAEALVYSKVFCQIGLYFLHSAIAEDAFAASFVMSREGFAILCTLFHEFSICLGTYILSGRDKLLPRPWNIPGLLPCIVTRSASKSFSRSHKTGSYSRRGCPCRRLQKGQYHGPKLFSAFVRALDLCVTLRWICHRPQHCWAGRNVTRQSCDLPLSFTSPNSHVFLSAHGIFMGCAPSIKHITPALDHQALRKA